MIGNLQLLRAFAASGVVIWHSHANIFGIHTMFHGVALFFVLSGYLMCKISNRSALDFARDRFWRIVPNYWLALGMLLSLFNMWTYWPVDHTVLSAFFIPHESPSGFYPVLGVGWTLNLEMYFYAVFALSILLFQGRAPIIAGLVILGVSAGLPYVTENTALLFYYSHDEVKYFVFGIVIWYFSEWIKAKNLPISLPYWTLPVALAVYALLVLIGGSPIIIVPALFLMAVFTASFGADLKSRILMIMGDASYACYLLHTILLEFLRHNGIDTSGTLPFTVGVLVGSWSIAIWWHIYVEKLISVVRSRSVSYLPTVAERASSSASR